MKRITDVKSFGAIAAEDDDIKRYFVQTPAFREITGGERQIIIGRKGAGKTALYLAVIDAASDGQYFAEGLTFRDYPWALHAKYAHEGVASYERFLDSWRFLTYMQVFKVLLTESERPSRYGKDAKSALDAVEKFIQRNWGVIAFDHKKTFPSGGFRLDGVKIAPSVLGNSAGGVEVKQQEGGLGETLVRLNEWLWNSLVTVGAAAPKTLVLFDELDAGYDPSAEDYLDRVIGLLLAIRRLSRDFKTADLPFGAIGFLRSDIFDNLHFGDKNKLIDANAITIEWNDKLEHEGTSLKELIDHRISEELRTGKHPDPWSCAFDGDVMRGTQHKFHHMAFRTFLRPRDVIKFANCALDEAKNRIAHGDKNALITNDDVRAARDPYSKYLLNELDDEISAGYPAWNDYLEILKTIGTTRFSRVGFHDAYQRVNRRSKITLDEDQLLEFFYRYSILGFERAAGGAGLEQHFRYQGESVRLNPDAREFMVHRGLKEALELKDLGSES